MYFIFAGNSYYPSGGFDDFIDTAPTLEAALELCANLSHDWWQIVRIIAVDGVVEHEIVKNSGMWA